MTTDVENNEWKAEAPYLAGLPKVNPFDIPEQYFNSLSSSISITVYTERLKEQIKETGFTVPENYFGELRELISLQTNSTHILNVVPKQNGYSTPDSYFQKLQANILAKTVEEVKPAVQQTRMIKLWHSDLLKYASAACFILVTAFGLYLNQQSFTEESKKTELANEQMLYDIDEQDIIDHVQGNDAEEQIPVLNVASQAELETYILNNYSQNDLSSNL